MPPPARRIDGALNRGVASPSLMAVDVWPCVWPPAGDVVAAAMPRGEMPPRVCPRGLMRGSSVSPISDMSTAAPKSAARVAAGLRLEAAMKSAVRGEGEGPPARAPAGEFCGDGIMGSAGERRPAWLVWLVASGGAGERRPAWPGGGRPATWAWPWP